MISVIVPVYQSENTLCRCLDSILAQSFSDIEMIIIDDGSSDKSCEICEDYRRKNDKIKFYRKEHSCVSDSRKMGMELASGAYLIHCDSDDWMEPNMLQLLHDKIVSEKADMVVCDFFEEFDKSQNRYVEFPSGIDDSKGIDSQVGCMSFSVWNKLVRTEFLRNNSINFLQGISYGEDLYMTLRTLSCNPKVAYVPQPLYHYCCLSADSLSKKMDEAMLSSYKKVVSSLSGYLHGPLIGKLNGNKSDVLIKMYNHGILTKEQCRNFYPEAHHVLVKASLRKWSLLPMVLRLYQWKSLYIIPSVFISSLYCFCKKQLNLN